MIGVVGQQLIIFSAPLLTLLLMILESSILAALAFLDLAPDRSAARRLVESAPGEKKEAKINQNDFRDNCAPMNF